MGWSFGFCGFLLLLFFGVFLVGISLGGGS